MSECKNHQNDSRENYLSSKTFIFVTGVEGSGTTMLLKVLDNLEECVAMGGNYFPQYVSDSAKHLNSLTQKLWSYPPPILETKLTVKQKIRNWLLTKGLIHLLTKTFFHSLQT